MAHSAPGKPPKVPRGGWQFLKDQQAKAKR